MPAVLDGVLPLEMVWYECEGGHQGSVSFPFEMVLFECESWSSRKSELALGDGMNVKVGHQGKSELEECSSF